MLCPDGPRTPALLMYLCVLAVPAVRPGHDDEPGVSTVAVTEGGDAVLPCTPVTKENLVEKLFDWKKDGRKEVFLYDDHSHYNNGRTGQDKEFKGRVFHFAEELAQGNASIVIRNTKVSDSGSYTCVFPRLQPGGPTVRVNLVVWRIFKDRSGEIPGAAPRPRSRILNITENGALLKCEVPGASPQPIVEWQDSGGNILPAERPQVSHRGDRYYVTLLTTVTKTTTNRFRCVARQEDIGHEIHDEIYVPFYEKEDKPCQPAAVWIAAWLSGVLTVAVPQALCVAAPYIRGRIRKTSPPDLKDDPLTRGDISERGEGQS